MQHADDFIRSFLEHYPQARSGQLTLNQLNKLMAEHQQKVNTMPIDDFDGISASQMYFLLNYPLESNCMLQYGKDVGDYADRVPLFKLSELLLNTIQDAGNLKLTVTGNLPVKVCQLLFDQQLIKWQYMEFIGRIKEDEILFLSPLKEYLLDQGIVKKRNNALSLTKNGEKLMYGPAFVRFQTLLYFFSRRFHWGNFYRVDDGGKCGQLGWAYSLLLLSRYGNQPRESSFYSQKLMQAFEPELYKKRSNKEHGDDIQLYRIGYDVRFFERFADWFGLVHIERRKNLQISFHDQLTIKKSELFDLLFREIK